MNGLAAPATSTRDREIVCFDGEHEQRLPLDQAASVAFETSKPVRTFPSYRGQRSNSGMWWFATSEVHVGFESWFERDLLMLLDFDLDVVAVSSQPFWLNWRGGSGTRSHAPDFFARHADGTASVIDCRPRARIKPRDREAFDTTAAVCSEVGWTFQLVDGLDPVVLANVRWLAGYRHRRHHRIDVATKLIEAFVEPTPLLAGVEAVGDPIKVLPVAYHLLWGHVLEVGIQAPLHEGSIVSCGPTA
jgi:hypothetical protein